MNTIREYLVMENAEQAARKPKILVVDDSDFMRIRMVKLLESDYDVIEADSSIAAIKKIVVNLRVWFFWTMKCLCVTEDRHWK